MEYDKAVEVSNLLNDIEHTGELIDDLNDMIATKEYLDTTSYLVRILGDAAQRCREYKNELEQRLKDL
jgi:hypothetical protein